MKKLCGLMMLCLVLSGCDFSPPEERSLHQKECMNDARDFFLQVNTNVNNAKRDYFLIASDLEKCISTLSESGKCRAELDAWLSTLDAFATIPKSHDVRQIIEARSCGQL